MCCASVCAAACAAASLVHAGGGPALSPEDLKRPQAVADWLKAADRRAPSEQAQQFYRLGDKAWRAGRWAAAAKGFGESALIHPTPEALMAYGQALLRERAGTQATATRPDLQPQHWQEAALILTTALAADDVLHTLKAEQRRALTADAACLSQAARGQPDADACPPLRAYQAVRQALKR